MDNVDRSAMDQPLGRVKLRSESGAIILIPTPSKSPNDPLNWSRPFKYYVAIVTCFGMIMTTFLAAGPTVAIVQVAMDFGSGKSTNLAVVIPQVSFFFTTSALLQGTGNLIWMPLITKYGRRPIYIISFTGYLLTAIWSGTATTFNSELIARVLLGFFSGAGECLGPRTISDVFFLHERASVMAMYNFAVATGVPIGIIISGAITLTYSWRVIYYVGAAMIGTLVLLIFFTLPETAFNRTLVNETDGNTEEDMYATSVDDDLKNPYRLSLSIVLNDWEKDRVEKHYMDNDLTNELGLPRAIKLPSESHSVIHRLESRVRRLEKAILARPPGYQQLQTPQSMHRRSYWSSLRFFSGEIYTTESLWKMFVRPFGLILLPPVTWAGLVMSVVIGFVVAITSTFANDFADAYGFTAFQSGLCFFSSLVGGILAIPAGGLVGEAVANYFTVRNRGIREPEFRLPAIAISVITAPLGLFLYGIGIQNKLPFMVPVVGLGLISFSSGQATNISLVYTLDSYSPVAGEVTISQLAFKSIIGFLLSAFTNVWIEGSGHLVAFTEMAAIAFTVLIGAVPLYYWGGEIRRKSLKWRVVKFVQWGRDRN